MMKGSSSCAIYGIKDSQKCKAAYSLRCPSATDGYFISFHSTEATFFFSIRAYFGVKLMEMLKSDFCFPLSISQPL